MNFQYPKNGTEEEIRSETERNKGDGTENERKVEKETGAMNHKVRTRLNY